MRLFANMQLSSSTSQPRASKTPSRQLVQTPLRIGVIGCGRVAREVHLRVLASLPQARVVALAEADENALQSARSLAPSANFYTNATDLINDSQVQAVVIAVPNALHASLAIQAFGRGLHVYLEKPLALDLGEAQEVVAAWQSAGTIGAVGFNYRFNPLLRQAATLIRQGAIGRLVGVRSSFCAPMKEAPSWKAKRQSGGGVLLDLASHHLDSLRALIDEDVVTAWAQIRSVRHEDDTATTELRLRDGTPVQGFFSQSAIERDLWEIEGESGRLRIDRYNMTRVEITRAGELGLGAQARRFARGLRLSSTRQSLAYLSHKQREPNHEPSYRIAWQHFIRAAQNGKQDDAAFATPLDGLRNLQIVLALEESARSGATVAL